MKRAFLFVLKFRMYTLPLPKPCLSSPSDKIYSHSQKAHTIMNHGSQLYWVHCYLKGHTTSTIYAKWLPFIKGCITEVLLPSPKGSSVWIMSWKMVFLMVLLCKDAELPPRCSMGLGWRQGYRHTFHFIQTDKKYR